MYRILGLTSAAMIALGVSVASADQVTGTIEEIDLTRNTFQIGDQVFVASPENTVGPTLEELSEGDEVEVFFSSAGGGLPINAMTITKVEDAGGADEVAGTVEEVDPATSTFVVGDKIFVVSPEATVGVPLDELKEGDEVMVVYDTADADEPIDVITISKMN